MGARVGMLRAVHGVRTRLNGRTARHWHAHSQSRSRATFTQHSDRHCPRNLWTNCVRNYGVACRVVDNQMEIHHRAFQFFRRIKRACSHHARAVCIDRAAFSGASYRHLQVPPHDGLPAYHPIWAMHGHIGFSIIAVLAVLLSASRMSAAARDTPALKLLGTCATL